MPQSAAVEDASEFAHTSVLLKETIEGLCIRPDGCYLDGTLGGGGHSAEIAGRLDPAAGGRLIGIDQDTDAIAAATKRLAPFGDRVTILKDNYENAAVHVRELGIDRVDGVMLDLGVSSYQFDRPERGFSYRADAPLDMRMDQEQGLTAADIVNTWEEKELFHILRDYGEEKFAANIAGHIVRARAEHRIETTMQLNAVIDAAIPARVRARDAGHPARKTYQALRIACNRELDVLTGALDSLMELLAPKGRIAVITFHSLEDRIVKNAYRRWEAPCICPPDFPVCTCGRLPQGRIVNRKPIVPGERELADNRRARSAKLRIFEKGTEV
ncbi:MAG: 16S rRNA (cytosine(1402)-N(4))-methyltransferase RsmH [Lachnospiraceae bacterium]|nr:16S rRNA (cytosine(1402)-N(4))-methyltransferase RsmH [Lachnospiraceae bacterium]